MITIAILGSGRVATSLAIGLAKGDHDIVVGTREAHDKDGWAGPAVRLAKHRDAIAAADVVFNATPPGGHQRRAAERAHRRARQQGAGRCRQRDRAR